MARSAPFAIDTASPASQCNSTIIRYQQLSYFSRIIIDYINEADALNCFYEYPVSFKGIEAAIGKRKTFKTDRETLVKALTHQYEPLQVNEPVKTNISRLKEENTFTITTAHQPNIFTGYLYFVYKILHTIRLATSLKSKYPQYQFVPVFYMGSEDADLDELGHVYLGGDKINWNTDQKGAVGRMQPKGLEKLLTRIEGELGVHPFGKAL